MSKPENKKFVERLFQRYELNIRKFLMRKAYQREDVDDLVQETFMKAHKVSDWKDVKNPEAFLVRIAGNAYNDHVRKENRNIVDCTTDAATANVEANQPTPENTVSMKQQIKELEMVVNSLTPRVKQSLILIRILNVSYAQASEIMNISVSTLESHVAKGMAECRRKLNRVSPNSAMPSSTKKVVSLSQHKYSNNIRTDMTDD